MRSQGPLGASQARRLLSMSSIKSIKGCAGCAQTFCRQGGEHEARGVSKGIYCRFNRIEVQGSSRGEAFRRLCWTHQKASD